MSKRRPVWITGVGTVNPLGHTFEATADHLLAGRSGIREITDFALPDHLSRIGGRIGTIPVPPTFNAEEFARLDHLEQALLWSAVQGLRSAGWWERRSDRRVGLVLGIGSEWMYRWEFFLQNGDDRAHDPAHDREPVLYALQRRLGLTGPVANVAAACAGGNYALAVARRWVELGLVDVCLAGSADIGVTPMSMACFGNLRALSRRNATPEAASRPFDRGRDGFVMGEGGAVLVLEAADSARRRGAKPYAEFAGFGSSSDASHIVIPSTDPAPAVAALRAALADAATNPDEIDYVNAHATSTPVGDTAETRVLQTVFGEAIRTVPVSSIKSMIGHMLSGAAAVNVVACLAALERQALPPTINLDEPDPECSLCHIPHQARPQRVRTAVSNSFGFGGSNTCVVLRKVA